MELIKTNLCGLYRVNADVFPDERGAFIKNFQKKIFETAGLECDFQEAFYSVSKKGVIRGMHFQVPPFDNAKLVYVVEGSILDVVLDLRRGSPTYGNFVNAELGRGLAHGFLANSRQATVMYLQTSSYSPECDTGIRWDSFGFNWDIDAPIISNRDRSFKSFKDFISPFTYTQTR
jgi:dTDP-4-dehydrorhamnose 3,5-epimerase